MSRVVREFDLSEPRGAERANPPKEIHTPLPIVAVTRCEGDAQLHVGDAFEDGLGLTVREGYRECLAPDDRLFLTNPEGSGTIEVVLTDEEDLLPGYGGTGGSGLTSISPERLPGNLANGETIAAGEKLAETVDVAGGDILRVRARVDGMTAWSEVDSQSFSGGPMYLDRDRERLYVLEENGDEFREYDVSNPDRPLQVASINLSTGNGAVQSTNGFGFDSQQQKLVTVVYDGTDTQVTVIDVSTLGSPSQTGSAVLNAGNDDTGNPERSRWGVHEASGRAVVQAPNETVHKVDINTATPTVEASNLPVGNDPTTFYSWQDRDVVLYVNDRNGFGDMALVVLTFQSNGVHSEAQYGIAGDEAPAESAFYVDEQSQYGFWNEDAGGKTEKVRMLDLTDHTQPDTVGFVEDTSFLQNENVTGFWTDREHPEPLLWAVGQNDLHFEIYTFADGELAQVDDLELSSSDPHMAQEIWHPSGGKMRVYSHDASGQLETWKITEGDVKVQLVPLLTTGARAQTGRSTEITLRDGLEGLVDLDLVGEASVDVVLENRGNQQGTIQYVETFVETV